MLLAVVGVAVVLRFTLNHIPSSQQPQPELPDSAIMPIGSLFIAMSVASLFLGVYNYFRTLKLYSTRRAIVQAGWLTQATMVVIGAFITAVAVLLTTSSRPPGL